MMNKFIVLYREYSAEFWHPPYIYECKAKDIDDAEGKFDDSHPDCISVWTGSSEEFEKIKSRFYST